MTMREKVARAIYGVADRGEDDKWDAVVERRTRLGIPVSSPLMDAAWKFADAALSALETPDEGMVREGSEVLCELDGGFETYGSGAKIVFAAMIRAAKGTTP